MNPQNPFTLWANPPREITDAPKFEYPGGYGSVWLFSVQYRVILSIVGCIPSLMIPFDQVPKTYRIGRRDS